MNLIEYKKLKARGLSLGEFYWTEFEVELIVSWNAAVVQCMQAEKISL